MTRMVETFFKQEKPKAKRRGLNPVGKKGRARQAALAAVPLDGPCEGQIPAVCTGWAEHRHHIRRRSQGGSDDRSNLALLCNRCHGWVHANPRDARERGLLLFGVDNLEVPK